MLNGFELQPMSLQSQLLIVLIFIAIFYGSLLILDKLFNLRKRGWEVGPGYLLIKTTRFNRIIDRIARKAPNLWRKIWNVGIIVGIIGMILIMGFLTYNFIILLTPAANELNAVLPLIPGVTVGGETLLQIIVPIIIIMVSHELAHGIAARIDKMKLKSSGFLMFLVLFGAFVEVDEKKMQKKSRKSQMRVFGAGSFANIMVGFFTFTIFINSSIFLSPFYATSSQGVLVHEVSLGPCIGYLRSGSVIKAINGFPILDQNWLTFYMMTNTKPNQTIRIITDSPIETILFHVTNVTTWVNTIIGPPLPYDWFPLDTFGALGVSVSNHYPANGILGFIVSWLGPIFYFSIVKTLSWIFILSIGIALFNLLPIPLFDGDKLLVGVFNNLPRIENNAEEKLNESSRTDDKENGKKKKYNKKDVIINIIRGYAIFLLLGSIIMTAINIIAGNFNLGILG